MDVIQAVVLSMSQLDGMLKEAARQGASLAVAELCKEIHQSPDDITLQRLKTYLANPGSIPDANACWAHSGIIQRIEPTLQGKPKSAAWFMKFQRETGLVDCHTRPSPAYGRRREWSFADIRLAWESYYGKR